MTVIGDIKNKKIISKKEISMNKNDEKIYSEILEYFERYNGIPENLDLIEEYSSAIIESEEIKNKNYKKLYITRIICSLNEIGYKFEII